VHTEFSGQAVVGELYHACEGLGSEGKRKSGAEGHTGLYLQIYQNAEKPYSALVTRPGFEPRQAESESAVLPLYYRAIKRKNKILLNIFLAVVPQPANSKTFLTFL
jgi:hypothetical protein